MARELVRVRLLLSVLFICVFATVPRTFSFAEAWISSTPLPWIYPSATCLHAKAKRRKKERGSAAPTPIGGGGFGNRKQNNPPIKADPLTLRTGSKSGLVQISESPLIFTYENFMEPSSCTSLTQKTSDEFCLEFRHRVSQLFRGQQSDSDGMKYNYASSRDSNNDGSELVSFPDGVHMDTNNDCIFRHITALLYLNDVPVECGGATLFPLANTLDQDPLLEASRRLLHENIGHTRSCGVVRKRGVRREADAQLLETCLQSNVKENQAIRVQPQAGKLLLFFSRTIDGVEDPRSWHGGERLRDFESSVTEKRLLTIFKQVDYGTVEPSMAASTFQTYLSHQIKEQRNMLFEQVV